MRDADDPVIFEAARTAGVDAVMTKDRDFVDLIERLGPPPKLIWITVGNTSNRNLKRILTATLRDAIDLLSRGESLVEISEQSP
jgi:predicted nuclease of predicted toxin-antitoxin system